MQPPTPAHGRLLYSAVAATAAYAQAEAAAAMPAYTLAFSVTRAMKKEFSAQTHKGLRPYAVLLNKVYEKEGVSTNTLASLHINIVHVRLWHERASIQCN